MMIAVQEFIDVLPEPVLVVSLRGTIVAANTAAAEFFGRSTSMLKGYSIFELTSDPREKVERYLTLCGRTRQPIPGSLGLRSDEQTVEYRLSGGVIGAAKEDERSILLRFVARQPANSRFNALNDRIVELHHEIAARRRAEKLIESQKHVLELLAHETPLQQVLTTVVKSVENMVDHRVRGSILLLNESGEQLFTGAAPSLPSEYSEAINGLMIGPAAGSCGTAAYLGRTVVVEDISTDPLWMSHREAAMQAGVRACWSTPIIGNTGKVLGTFAMYYDHPHSPTAADIGVIEVVTRTVSIAIEKARAAEEKRRAEEVLRRTEKLAAAGRLAATIAHEINNPLEAVTNLLYLAAHSKDTGPDSKRFLKMADDELARVAHIAKQTLGFYRETGQPEVVNVDELLNSVLAIYVGKLNAKGINVIRNFAPVPSVFAGRGELRQLFSNLIANAIDALEPDGELTTSICSCTILDNLRVCVTIRDNGVGIRPEHRARLFEPFFTTKHGVGTGLGLWVSQGIVEKYNGCLRVESSTEGPSRGTEFSIELPAHIEAGRMEPLGAAG